ncbi:MAG: cell division protein FtsA [Anaerolineae bacterium]|jgi:cell division protein FtsA|nr:cell division protein FtsA [Anaerolineae bacterium]MBT7076040.1 cell division protein FtsA [Anaerolineae bacterium]MBT7782446.1 cell division protein FtsA [Anaerolineae bacterium]
MEEIVVGIDVGTTKVCTLVGRFEGAGALHILGVGIEPSNGIKKGVIVDLEAASRAIIRSVERAEQSSGIEIASALVSIAGAHVSSINSRGVVSISGEIVDDYDVIRVLEAARSVAIPHNREVIHIVQRGFSIDGQDGINEPIGMHGYKLEVETHIVTASAATVENLRKCVGAAGVEVQQFVLNPLASAEAVLTENERLMGTAICDIGGGTTDMAIYVDGKIWHTMVLAVGGNHVTSDIAHGLRLSVPQAEEIKLQQGYAIRAEVGAEDYFSVRPFGEDNDVNINKQELAHIIEARVEEIFELALQEIKRSGYDGLLPAGMVLTGGVSALPAIRDLASDVLGIPVRIAQPENITGMIEKLHSPAYSTGVGLLYSALITEEISYMSKKGRKARKKGEKRMNLGLAKNLFKRLLP